MAGAVINFLTHGNNIWNIVHRLRRKETNEKVAFEVISEFTYKCCCRFSFARFCEELSISVNKFGAYLFVCLEPYLGTHCHANRGTI